MSTLDRAIFAQECDDLPGFTEPHWETDSDNTEDDVELRGDEAEEETEDVAEEELESPVVTGLPRSAEEEIIDTVSVTDRI